MENTAPSPSSPAEQVRQLLSKGETGPAVQLLSGFARKHPSICDDAILLESSMNNLEQKVFEGTISQEDETIEERRITKGVLRLANLLEQLDAGKTIAPTAQRSTSIEKAPASALPWWWGVVAILAIASLAWAFWGRPALGADHDANPPSTSFDLEIEARRLGQPSNLLAQGTVRILLGTADTLAPQPLDAQGHVVFRNLPARLRGASVMLLPGKMNYQFKVVEPETSAVAGTSLLVFGLAPKMAAYTGKLLNQRGAAVAGALLDFGDGLATATTNAAGAFQVELPIPTEEPAQVRVKVTHKGKTLKDEKMWQSPGVLGELKVFE